MDLPTFSDATESAQAAADSVRDHGRVLLPWLPTPPDCGRCGAQMYADVTFDPDLVDYVDCWECRECGRQSYRDDPGPPPESPSRGAPDIREALRR